MNKIDKIKKEIDKIVNNKYQFDFNMSQKQREENIKQGLINTIHKIYGKENIDEIQIDINEAGMANINIDFVDNDETREWIDNANKKGLVK